MKAPQPGAAACFWFVVANVRVGAKASSRSSAYNSPKRRRAASIGAQMILTNCPACAAPLPPLAAKQCSRCKTRYCGSACQAQHWKEGGHDKLCKKIRKGGGAEQYHADNKYAEAVAVAVEKCAEDTKGQTCYICMEAVHSRTGEGLVRECACHTTEGFVHVSCLAEQAKILVAEAEENNLGHEVLGERCRRWDTCSLCEQRYYGVVRCALGWACWKTYVDRPETDQVRGLAMSSLGNGLGAAEHHEDALSVREAELSMLRRLETSEESMLAVQANLAGTYYALGRVEDAILIERDVYAGRLKLSGEEGVSTLISANNYATSLASLTRFEEAKSLLRKTIPVARRVFGESDDLTLAMKKNYARSLYENSCATLGDLHEAVNTLVETERTARRVLGISHPDALSIEEALRQSRAVLRVRELTCELEASPLGSE